MPSNSVFNTIISGASLEIAAKSVRTLSHADPSAPITTVTIVTVLVSSFLNYDIQVLIFGYLVGFCTYHIIFV